MIVTRTPTLLPETYSKDASLARVLSARPNSESQADAIALAFATVTCVGGKVPDQLQTETSYGLLRNEHGGVHGAEFAEGIVRRRRVFVAQCEPDVARLEAHPNRRFAFSAITVSNGVRE